MKLGKSITFWLIIILFCTSCEIETSIKNVEKLTNLPLIKICQVSYGGFAGKGRASYDFYKMDDSVYVHLIFHNIRPKEHYRFNISYSEFDDIQLALKCMINSHYAVNDSPHHYLYSEYFVHGGLETLNILPGNANECCFNQLLSKKYEKEYLKNHPSYIPQIN